MEEDDEEPILFAFSGVNTNLSEFDLEQIIASELKLDVTILEKDSADQCILFVVNNDVDGKDDEAILSKVQDFIDSMLSSSGEVLHWIANPTMAKICKADMEEEIFISEEEAYDMWLNNDDSGNDMRTSDLGLVPSPDGFLIQPSHDTTRNNADVQQFSESPKQNQIQRDPKLLEFDNVPRIHMSELDLSSYDLENQPIVLTGFFDEDEKELQLDKCQQNLSFQNLVSKHGDVIVRTGNRETLIENGFHHSKPQTLQDIFHSFETCKSMIFTPIKELSESFQKDLIWATKNENSIFEHILEHPIKHTLCLAPHQGFGIGMHKHGPAMFLLVQGRKKWYLSPPKPIDDMINSGAPTHPDFYTSLSSHKCIQKPGEILFVPSGWYHEIFNLDHYTVGIQALSDRVTRRSLNQL